MADRDFEYNISAIGRMFDIHRSTLRKYILEEGVKPSTEKAGIPLYRLKDMAPVLERYYESTAVSMHTGEPDLFLPRDRLHWFQSETERLKFLVTTGKVEDIHDVRRDMAVIVRQVANFFDSLPDILERDFGVDVKTLQEVQDSLDQVREELYRELFNPEDGSPEPNSPDGSDDRSASS
ncbi:DUF1441 family protein [Marinobacterium sp. D7]|uniref:DUF1441 family protein n=1 Tax=Marinobacterium ramblicola TaxID=2849041 RepID=UPI001C2D7EB7|nr:DUF1441 family protein [Marinobacterium ramblicola]MBV1788622.1 DUF1441 family protein [Marinobacterium ramblicola]